MSDDIRIRRYRHKPFTVKELKFRLTSIGMSEAEFGRMTGVRGGTYRKWLAEGVAPQWVRSFLIMAAFEAASEAVHANLELNLISEEDYRADRDAVA